MSFDFEAGEVLLIDKPLEWTSFDVVKKVRNAIRIKKVGHAGTLDPLATGLLILCTGKKTKTIDSIQARDKEYTGTFEVGATTPSFDLETAVEVSGDWTTLTHENIYAIAQQMQGAQNQVPPMYSALQVNGVRLYKLARKGQEIEIQPRPIEISVFEITAINLPTISFRIRCTKGTYIRSIARDLGIKLGVGAYLSSLRRTQIGDINVANAYTMEDLLQIIKQQKEESNL